MRRFACESPFRTDHPSAGAVYCSDGRFTRAVEELLTEGLGQERLDVLAIPGGPALLETNWAAKFFEVETVRNALLFLIDKHKLKTVALIAHCDCGFYREKYPGTAREEVRKIQETDLKRAKTAISAGRTIDVRLFYATVIGDVMAFDEVEG